MAVFKYTGTAIVVATGDGISGATVKAWITTTNTMVASTTSESGGSFVLERDEMEGLTFTASKSGFDDPDLAVINLAIASSTGSTNM
jgi:hypothetical protein